MSLTIQQTPNSGVFQAQMCEEPPICQCLEWGWALTESLGSSWRLTGSPHPPTDLNREVPAHTTKKIIVIITNLGFKFKSNNC